MAGTHSHSIGAVNPKWKIAIVRSSWHPECVDLMASEARTELLKQGILLKNIVEVQVPGSFEIPLACKRVIEKKKVDAVLTFGVIVQGQTHHARLIAEESAGALMRLSLEKNLPVVFEIVFVDKIEHAKARSTGPNGKGPHAAQTALTTLAKLKDLG
ncbi:MAG TPA: 6,7-dimethyl-8-ribityllumazine synthase [Candidatus Peribacteria bacterium]|nr:6,7-dimethyl-8-ribityllumazine synthase [Candidatus Peribacteria bacterium]